MTGLPTLPPAIAALLEEQDIGIANVAPDGLVIDVTPGFERLVGRSAADIIARPLLDLQSDGGVDLVAALADLEGTIGPLPRRLLGPDGTVAVDVTASREPDGSLQLVCRPHRRQRVSSADERHQEAIDRLPIGVVELQIGRDSVRTNKIFRTMVGTDVDDMVGLRAHVVDNDRLDALVADAFLHVAQGGAARADLELRHAEGQAFPARVRVQMVAATDDDDGFLVVTVEDLTTTLERDRDHQRLLGIVDATTELVGVCDIRTGDFIYMNESARDLLGWHGFDSVPAQAIFTETTHPTFENEIVPALRRHEPWRGDIEVQTPNGPRTLDCSILRTSEAGDSVVCFLGRDVTEIRASAAEFARLANHDELTGTLNRAGLLSALHDFRRRGESYALLYLDLDRFKVVNDSHGHQAGDELLVAVARRLLSIVRGNDCVARIGGDEFVIAAPAVDVETAQHLAERIRLALGQPVATSAGTHATSTSIGAAMSALVDEPEAVLRDADAALYRAKSRGRNRVEMFSAAMRIERTVRSKLADDLRIALAKGCLDVAYQPIVRLADGMVTGIEALARWNHPEHGPIPPDTFIALAEQHRIVADVDRYVWARAIEDVGRMQSIEGAPLCIHANLSPLHLQRLDELVATVVELIDDTDFDPERLCLEITESALVADVDAARRSLAELSALGIELGLDDFGTGYSGLGSVAGLDLDVLKIDRQFVADLTATSHGPTIAQCIVDLAHGLDLGVVAEGVESADQAAMLEAMGCRKAQGYYFHRPMPIDQLRALLIAAPADPA